MLKPMLVIKNSKGEYFTGNTWTTSYLAESWSSNIDEANVFKGTRPVNTVLKTLKEFQYQGKFMIITLEYIEASTKVIDMMDVK